MLSVHFIAVLFCVVHDQVLQVGFIPSVIDRKDSGQKEEDSLQLGWS